MTNIQEQIITGSRWLRATSVTISNEYNRNPVLTWDREWLTVLSDGTEKHEDAGSINIPYDPAGAFKIYDPQTNTELSAEQIAYLAINATEMLTLAILYSKFVKDHA